MSCSSSSISEEVCCLFVPLTRESLTAIEARIAEENARQVELAKKGAEQKVRCDDEGQDEGLHPDETLMEGMRIPFRKQRSFSPGLASIPLEDIDTFYHNQRTFVVISNGKVIYRFSATDALWILDPFNPIRRIAIHFLVHPVFLLSIIATILINCFFMIMPVTQTIKSIHVIFTGIYTFELAIKVIARGFILQPFTYLRDAWNWLDFVLIVMAYETMGLDVGILAIFEPLRLLRVLKAATTIVPGLKKIYFTVIESLKNLRDLAILSMFLLFMFALLGLQIYMGVLTQKCIKNFPTDGSWGNLTDESWFTFCSNQSHWYIPEDVPEYVLCGNSSGSGLCPPGYTCLQGFGSNPNYGYTNFDTFGWASLSVFSLMTQDYWENIYQQVLRSAGPWQLLFFIVIALVSVSLLNLVLSIVALSYDELGRKAEEEKEAEEYAIMETEAALASAREARRTRKINGKARERVIVPLAEVGSPSGISCLSYEQFVGQTKANDDNKRENMSRHSAGGDSISEHRARIAGDHGTLVCKVSTEHLPYADDSNAVTPMSEEKDNLGSSQGPYVPHGDHLSAPNSMESQMRGRTGRNNPTPLIPDDHKYMDSSVDIGDGAKHIDNPFIEQMQQTPNVGMDDEDDGGPTFREKILAVCLGSIDIFCVWDYCWLWLKFQEYVALLVSDPFFVLFIMICAIVNPLLMALEHYDMDKDVENALNIGKYFFIVTYAIEALLKLIAMSPKYYFQERWNIFHFVIVALSLMELGMESVHGLSALQSFRLLQVFKLVKSWPTLNLLISIMGRTLGGLGNLSFVLCNIIFIFAVMGMQLFGKNYYENVKRFPDGELPRWNFTDFMHSFMIVFRALCGEWMEPMWDCMLVGDWFCVPFFLAVLVIGKLVVLNLFLVLLLSNFGSSSLSAPRADNEQRDKITEAFDRFSRFFKWIKCRMLNVGKVLRDKLSNQTSDDDLLKKFFGDLCVGKRYP